MKIAIIGAGISGLSAAWALQGNQKEHPEKSAEVTVYEANSRLGGHSHTIEVAENLPLDVGFLVHNDRTYPNLIQLFQQLGVEREPSDMSFAFTLNQGRLEYEASRGGLFQQRRNLLRPTFLRMIYDILRFHRRSIIDAARVDDQLTLGEYLQQNSYSQAFRRWHILPMAAAIWSTGVGTILDFPFKTFVQFFRNHGLLQLDDRPQWYSMTGGSQRYVAKIAENLGRRLHRATPVTSLKRIKSGIKTKVAKWELYSHDQKLGDFDHVIFATHSDQAVRILTPEHAGEQADDVAAVKRLLARLPYQENQAYLHQDASLMPRRRSLWASWNYSLDTSRKTGTNHLPVVTYWLNLLQNHLDRPDYFVTLNPPEPPQADKVIQQIQFQHPLFTTEALAVQRNLPYYQGKHGLWFAGAWCGYGFHEDGCSAGLAVAQALGVKLPFDYAPSYADEAVFPQAEADQTPA